MIIKFKDGSQADLYSGNCGDYDKIIKAFKLENVDDYVFLDMYYKIHNKCNIFSEMMFLGELKRNGIDIGIRI